MERLIRDGKVAVLVSPGFGAGWSTWNGGDEGAIFNRRLALAVLGESGESKDVAAREEFPDFYHGGVEDLVVEWVSEGEQFYIDEYDGSESLIYAGDQKYFSA